MKSVIRLFHLAIHLVITQVVIAQNYHREDSMLYTWMKQIESQLTLQEDQVQKMEQDSINKIMFARKTTQWKYAGSDRFFLLHKQNIVHGISNNNTPAVLSWEECDTCPAPHDSAWISQQMEKMKKKN